MILIEGVASIVRGDIIGIDGDDILPEDPYLCTGFDIYLAEEPDLMSSMALVHSRIRRVIYMKSQKGKGALGSKMYLHQLRSLNHKFRVFRVIN
jgi:tRNA-specific adenosine deaminase 3